MKVGDTVSWNWGGGTSEGRIVERFERRVQRTLKGSRIVRRGSPACPAFLIRQEDRAAVLKLASEIETGS